jgi:hypothetical protein
VQTAFAYEPDHLILEYKPTAGNPVQLRIDYQLFVALEKLKNGLPRQLIPDREVNRIEAFVEQLRRTDIAQQSQFFIHNHNDRTTLRMKLSLQFDRYEEIEIK